MKLLNLVSDARDRFLSVHVHGFGFVGLVAVWQFSVRQETYSSLLD